MTLDARYHRASYMVGAFLLTIISLSAHALDVPPLKAHVNDYAGILSAGTVSNLEAQLVELEKSDSTQVAVLTIPSLEGEVLEEFSIKVAEKWKIGQQKVDNGVILLISKTDRKIRIEVGRGLEGKLTDLISGRIIRDEITPKFKNGDYDGGIVAGVSAIITTIKGEYKVEYKREYESSKVSVIDEIFDEIKEIGSCILFFLMLILGVVLGILGNGGGSSSGGSSFSSRGSSFSSGGSSFSSGSSSSYSGGGGSFGGGGASGSW